MLSAALLSGPVSADVAAELLRVEVLMPGLRRPALHSNTSTRRSIPPPTTPTPRTDAVFRRAGSTGPSPFQGCQKTHRRRYATTQMKKPQQVGLCHSREFQGLPAKLTST